MKPNDLTYARELFSDLVTKLAVDTSSVPSRADVQALAARTLRMAEQLARAQERIRPRAVVPPIPTVATTSHSKHTFGEIAAQWLSRAVKRSPARKKSIRDRFNRFLLPHFAPKPVDEIEPREILAVLRAIEEVASPWTAYSAYCDLRYVFRYALLAGLANTNPAALLTRALTKPARKRPNVLTDAASVGRLLAAIRHYKGNPRSTARYMLQMMPMVFLRARELRTLEWRDVDLDAAVIVVPATRMKMRRPHIVPLARQAVRLLHKVHMMTGCGRYVFTSDRSGDNPMSPTTVNAILRRLGYTNLAGSNGFRIVASTWLNEQGWRADAIERQLSHVGHERVRRTYNQAQYLSERTRMMQQWADHLEMLERKARTPLHCS